MICGVYLCSIIVAALHASVSRDASGRPSL